MKFNISSILGAFFILSAILMVAFNSFPEINFVVVFIAFCIGIFGVYLIYASGELENEEKN